MAQLEQLRDLVGAGGYLPAEAVAERSAGIWRADHLQAGALVRPQSTEEVARVLAWCNEHGVAVGTVEHVMAALAGCGITDATVEVSGPEMPIMDGSAMPFVRRIVAAGTRVLAHRAAAIRIDRPVTVRKDGKSAALLPAERFEMDYAIVFSDSAIGEQALALTLTGDAFVTELADCRTFGHLTEVEQLRAMGLAKGGGLNNAIVVDRGRVLNPEGLRRPDEFVRHKMLDAVGDLALAGAPIIGRYVGLKSGHEMTNLLVRALFAAPDAWHWDEIGEREALGVSGDGLPDARGAAAIAV